MPIYPFNPSFWERCFSEALNVVPKNSESPIWPLQGMHFDLHSRPFCRCLFYVFNFVSHCGVHKGCILSTILELQLFFSTSGFVLHGSSGATKGVGLNFPPALFLATAFAAIAAAIVPFCLLFYTFVFIFYTFCHCAFFCHFCFYI